MKVDIGKTITLDVDVTRFGFTGELSPVAEHIIYIGLRNQLMDAHANMTKEEGGDDYIEKSRAMSERKLEAMYNGVVRVAGTRESDPVRGEAKRLATNAFTAILKGKNIKPKDYDKADFKAKVAALMPKYMEQAAKNIAEAAAIDIGEIDV